MGGCCSAGVLSQRAGGVTLTGLGKDLRRSETTGLHNYFFTRVITYQSVALEIYFADFRGITAFYPKKRQPGGVSQDSRIQNVLLAPFASPAGALQIPQ